MKKIILICLAVLILTSCQSAKNDDEVLVIRDKVFIEQVNELYLNADKYNGKTVKYEGIFLSENHNGTDFYYVIRYGPGCCGNDGLVGFEIIYEPGEYPENNSWVEAVGVLEELRENGKRTVRLNLTSLTVVENRGEDYVG